MYKVTAVPRPRPTLKTLGIVPEPGMVLMCDFHGYVEPEMVKNRHVIVLSSKLINSLGTVVVVPISKNMPVPFRQFHVHFPADCYACFTPAREHWAKCNLVAHVRFDRLDRVKANGVWCTPLVSAADLAKIRAAVRHAIGA
jgi:uncharacterized protein YifN (PemK superfamily)